MSRAPLESEPGELLRRLAQEVVPAGADDASPARRDRLVRSMKDALDRSAEGAERSRRWRRGGAVVAAAAGFLLLSGLLLKEHGARAAHAIAGLDRVSGTVVLTQDGNVGVVGASQRALRDGDSVQTAAGAHAHLATHKSSVNVSESTELKLSQPSPAEERISLRRGRVDVSVDKTVETKRSVVVETPDAEVVVRGTVFDVRVEPLASATNTHVHVTRGSVWVLAQGVQVALLSAGQSWSSAGGVEAAEPKAAVIATPSPERETPSPGRETPSPGRETPSPGRETPSRGRGTASLATPSVVGKGATPVTSPGRDASRRVGTLAEENRLFAAGVEARNRGEAARAAELFGELLNSYPQSTLREVAQVERFRALGQAGQTARAAGEARSYLAEHADGAARSEARDVALSDK